MRIGLLAAAAVAIAIVVMLLAQDQPSAPPRARSTAAAAPALEAIQAPALAAHIRFLSDDLLEGRAPSTRGGQLAASYLATQLAGLGYEPAGADGSYFQQVPVVESAVDPSFTMRVGSAPSFRYLRDVVAFSGQQGSQVEVAGELVFVGHGIVAPEYDWNDFAGIDMRGRVALIMVNDPPASAGEPQLFGGPALTYYGRWTYKYEEAARQGAAGAILIHTDESATYPWQVVQSSWSGTQYSLPAEAGQPALALKAWVTDAAAHQMVLAAGRNLDELRRAARSRGTKPVPLGVRVEATLRQSVARKTSPNVIGVLKGRSPGQAIIYTAHYDHFGTREARPDDPPDADRVFNGALDNASGVAGVLEIAEAFARAAVRPERSIYVMFTTAEESGLLGAEYFAAHLPLPAGAWAANINVDELNLFGRTRDIVLLGAERSTIGDVVRAVAMRRERVVSGDSDPGRGLFFRSDHFPLARIGVPAISISEPTQYLGKDPEFGKKLHEDYNNKDYHQPSDEFRSDWDYSGAIEDLRLLADLGWQLANESAMPRYHDNEQFAQPRKGQGR
jgi:Zn-dependent M28 family amino/carboxypeptidase